MMNYQKELEKLMLAHDLYLDEGYLFGEEGSGFERWNIACPKQELLAGLERFKKAIAFYLSQCKTLFSKNKQILMGN